MKRSFIIAIAISFFCLKAFSQNPTGIKAFDLYSVKQTSPGNLNKVKVSMMVKLEDTLQVEKLKVTIVDSSQTPILTYSRTFTYDYFGLLSDGTKYNRKGKNVLIELGEFNAFGNIHAEASLKKSAPQFLDAVVYRSK